MYDHSIKYTDDEFTIVNPTLDYEITIKWLAIETIFYSNPHDSDPEYILYLKDLADTKLLEKA